MSRQKFRTLNPLGHSGTETSRSYLGDIIDIVGENKVSTEDERILEMKAHDPDLLLAGVAIPRISKPVINAGKSLKAIVCTAMGIDFDIGAATEKGIFAHASVINGEMPKNLVNREVLRR